MCEKPLIDYLRPKICKLKLTACTSKQCVKLFLMIYCPQGNVLSNCHCPPKDLIAQKLNWKNENLGGCYAISCIFTLLCSNFRFVLSRLLCFQPLQNHRSEEGPHGVLTSMFTTGIQTHDLLLRKQAC